MNTAHPLHHPPRLALTPGEPAGIGPDLTVRIAQEPLAVELVAVADPALLATRAEQLGLPLTLEPFDPEAPARPQRPGVLKVLEVPLCAPSECGVLDPANAVYVLNTLTLAATGCLEGQFDALVTGPVHKGIINDAGIPFTGHTEFLQQMTGTEQVVMMLATSELKVALVTTHLPLSQVSAAITPQRLTLVLRVLQEALTEQFGMVRPRILVCGLNPHAGEGGHLGHEEIDVIAPVLEQMRAEGLRLEGPIPADTAFTPPRLAAADAVLTMYHDQGLPVLKHVGFGRAVNITLGLPLIRTSVDHGTALDLAGTGRADTGSLITALTLAETMARNSHIHAG